MTTDALLIELRQHLTELCAELLPGGRVDGGAYRCQDVTGGAGDNLTLLLEGDSAGNWYDAETNEAGDALQLVAVSKMISASKATQWAEDWLKPRRTAPPLSDVDRQAVRARLGLPMNNGEFDPLELGYKRQEEEIWRHGSKAYTYRDSSGAVIGYTVEFADGSIRPVRQVKGKWRWAGWKHPEPKPLYNAHLLLEKPDAPVNLCPTEAEADRLAPLFPNEIFLSWQGGPKTISGCDWTPLKERAATATDATWPDGSPMAPGAVIRIWPGTSPATATYLKALLPTALVVPNGTDPAQQHAAALENPAERPAEPEPFRCIGHDEAGFYYHSYRSGYVVHLKASEHTELNLQTIAPDSYWLARGFYAESGTGVDWKAVAKHLIASNYAVGHFDTARVRGLGCWIETRPDGTEVGVYHAGDCLYVDGVRTPLGSHQSNYIYPRRRSLHVNFTRVATAEEGRLVLQMCELMPWAPNQLPWAFAGWHFLATVCGALDWRPPIWVWGPSSAGKSWIFANFTAPLLGDSLFKILSATTAPGVRQGLSCDALPVAGDEIEPNSAKAQARIAGMCDLVRQATTETGGSIYHGTTDGTGRAYRIRSCFAFSSIVPGTLETADENRFTKFGFVKRPDQAPFEQLATLCQRLPELGAALRARAILLVVPIRQAAATFRRAVTKAARDSRKGQQFGSLAAGFWMLTNDVPPTQEQADAWAATVDWNGLGHDSTDDDATRAIDVLLAYKTNLQDAQGHRYDMTVGELVDIYFSDALPTDPRTPFAYEALMRLGLHPIGNRNLDVAVRWPALRTVFANTQFVDHWADNLRHLEGAKDSLFKASADRVVRSIRVPL